MYSEYEISQMLRKKEREIRALKREKIAYKTAIEEGQTFLKSDLTALNGKIKDKSNQIQEFCNQTGYNRDRFREQVGGKTSTGHRKSANSLSKNNQYFRPVTYGESTIIKRGNMELNMRHVTTTVNDIYVSTNCNLKRKELHSIDVKITKALKRMKLSNRDNLPAINIITHNEMQKNAIASYNAVTNTLMINEIFGGSIEQIAEIQRDGTCPNNELSTIVHELFHWADAQEYQKHFGKITSENYGQYIAHLNQNRKKTIDKLGIKEYNVSEISEYAKKSFKEQKFDEVFTEYRVQEMMR